MQRAVLFLGLILTATVPANSDEESFVDPNNGARFFNCADARNERPAREVVVVEGLAICRIQVACDVAPGGATGDQVTHGVYSRASCAPDHCLTKSVYACMREKLPTKAH